MLSRTLMRIERVFEHHRNPASRCRNLVDDPVLDPEHAGTDVFQA